MDFKKHTIEEIVDWIDMMHAQNLNGRESEEDSFRLGIEAAVRELMPTENLVLEYYLVEMEYSLSSIMVASKITQLVKAHCKAEACSIVKRKALEDKPDILILEIFANDTLS
jgi:hypothetical protein